MELTVLVEPQAVGYRDSTQSSITLSAKGVTESAAIASQKHRKRRAGG
jgi:hypothetical protein